MKKAVLYLSFLYVAVILRAQPSQESNTSMRFSPLYPLKPDSMKQVEYTQTLRHLNIPEFWIGQLPHPDKVILDEDRIRHLNSQNTHQKNLIFPSEDFNLTYSGAWVKQTVAELHGFLEERGHYFEHGDPVTPEYLSTIYQQEQLEAIPPIITTRYALVVDYALQRLTPTHTTMLKSPDQTCFDRNQNAALDIGTPVAVLHESIDKQWYFVLSPTSYGWVRAEDIAFATRHAMIAYARSKEFIITISPKNALLIDGKYDNFVRMGVRLPALQTPDTEQRVTIPKRTDHGTLRLVTATIKRSDTHKGYLPYTGRTIITQAFKYLNSPYGWGGMFSEVDCSKMIQAVFATTGIILPRNSKEQQYAGTGLIALQGDAHARTKQLIDDVTPAGTFLYLPGHIMLYLGAYQGVPYIIHTVWGDQNGSAPIAKTTVSPISFKDTLTQLETAVILGDPR